MTTWGLASTIQAPTADVLRFVAYHLDAGADRLWIFLDDANPATVAALEHHPKITVIPCDAAHWQKIAGNRPDKHQLRQTANATFAYAGMSDADWMIHMDVDEFLVCETSISQVLGSLPAHQLSTRIRPMESLAGDGTLFKAFVPPGRHRTRIVNDIYPNFGRYIKGGFLSHVAGKPFLRTGLGDVKVKIHQAFQGSDPLNDDEMNRHIDMAHCHAKSWDHFIAQYRYRLEKGSYRAELGPAGPRDKGGMTLHEVFRMIEETEGEAGLRAFYDEVCADTPRLRQTLEAQGLLRRVVLPLDTLLAKYFPDASTV